MNIIIACEESQEVCKAFRAKGHNAFSCDLQQCSGGRPQWHIISDNDMHLKDILYNGKYKWDMLIGHPPCTRLTNSAVWYVKRNNLKDEVYQAACFFNMMLNAPIEKICLENPIQHDWAREYIRKQDQVIQPHDFGEDASKATCLWLKNLPLLQETSYFPPRIVNGKKRWGNQTPGGHNKLGPSADRAKLRSKTYPGIANAMADQWSLDIS